MEEIELFTASGEPTGKKLARPLIHKEGHWHHSVHVWLLMQDQLLFQKRAESKDSHPGLWDVSVGGHIAYGEDPLATAIRECEEELGIQTDHLEYWFKTKHQYVLQDGKFVDNEWISVYGLKGMWSRQDFSIPTEEVSEIKWVSISDCKSIIEKKDPSYVPHWVEYQEVIEYLS